MKADRSPNNRQVNMNNRANPGIEEEKKEPIRGANSDFFSRFMKREEEKKGQGDFFQVNANALR